MEKKEESKDTQKMRFQLKLLLNVLRSSWPDDKFDCKETSQGFVLHYKGHKVLAFLDLLCGGERGFECSFYSGTKSWVRKYGDVEGNVEEMKRVFGEFMEFAKAAEK